MKKCLSAETPFPETGLTDLRSVTIERDKPLEERLRSFVEQIKTPYCFRCSDTVVRISFTAQGPPLEDLLLNYLHNVREMC